MTLLKGIGHAYTMAKSRGYIPSEMEYKFDEKHYNIYESLMTGRDIQDTTKTPLDKFKGLFSVVQLRCATMAHKINNLLAKADPDNDVIFALCGIESMAYQFGIPKGIWNVKKELESKTYLIGTHKQQKSSSKPNPNSRHLSNLFDSSTSAVDLFYLYSDNPKSEEVKTNLKNSHTHIEDPVVTMTSAQLEKEIF
jgi:hypothetical protein